MRKTLWDIYSMSLDVKIFLFNFSEGRDLAAFKKIIRKIEITRKAYEAYDEHSWKETSNVPMSNQVIEKLIDMALSLSVKNNDFKLMNASLKLLDQHLLVPLFNASEEQRERAKKNLSSMCIS